MNVALSLLLLILFVIAVGKLAGRLLGIRLGHLRGAIVGLLGWVAGLLAAIYIVGEPSELLMHAFGRTKHALVTFEGQPDALALLESAEIGL